MGDAAQAPDDEVDVATLRERRAAENLLKYIPLDGHIACIGELFAYKRTSLIRKTLS